MAALKDLYVKRNGAPSAPRGSWAEHVDELNKMSTGVMPQGETAGNGAFGWLKDSADAGFFSALGGTARLAGEFLPFGNETLNSWADKADEIARRNSPQPGQNLEGLDYVASAVGNALGSGAASALEAGAVAGLGSLLGAGGAAGAAIGAASKVIPGVGKAAQAGKTLWKSPMGKYLVAKVGGSPFEAASEAGNLISDMRNENQQGTANYSDQEIRDAAIRSGALNLGWLTGMNMLEAGTLGKITGALGGDMAAKGAKDIAKRVALGGAADAISEGAEEYGQNLIGDYSKRGSTSDFNYDEAWEAAKMGAIGGGVLGGIGSGLSAKFSKNKNADVSAEADSEGGTIEDGKTTTSQDAGREAFINAIAGQESGGNYDAVNGRTGAAGKYQIMPENWPAWAEEAGLGADAEMTPENQEIVARYKLGEYYDKYGARGAAMAWYAGEGSLNYSEEALNRKQGNGDEPSINEYADSVLARMGNYADTARIDDREENYFDESNYIDPSITSATAPVRGFDLSHLDNGEASDAESLSQFDELSPEAKAQREADERRKQFNKLMDELRAAGDPQRAAQYAFERQNVPADPLTRSFSEESLPGIDAQKPFDKKIQTNLMRKRGRAGNVVSPDVQFEQGSTLPSLMQMARSPREMANATNFELMNQRSIANKNWEQSQQTLPRYDTQAVDAALAEQQREEDRQKLGLLMGAMRESRAMQQGQEQSAKQSERQKLAGLLGRIAGQKWDEAQQNYSDRKQANIKSLADVINARAAQQWDKAQQSNNVKQAQARALTNIINARAAEKWDEVPTAEKFKFVPQRRSMYDGAMRRNLAAQDRIKPDEQPSVKPTPVNRRALEGRNFIENVIAAGRKDYKNGKRSPVLMAGQRRTPKLSADARIWRKQYQNDKTEREALRDAAISVWQGDPKHPMKECRRLLNMARNMRKEILQPIVDNMVSQGIKQGVEFIPIEDRRTMRESHNAMWYRNYYKENKKAPSQTAMYDIAEDIFLGRGDKYGVGYYAGIDGKGLQQIAKDNHAELDYINKAIEAYETLELKLKENPNYGKEWATGEATEARETKAPRNSEAAEVKAEPTAKSDKDEVNKKAPALAEDKPNLKKSKEGYYIVKDRDDVARLLKPEVGKEFKNDNNGDIVTIGTKGINKLTSGVATRKSLDNGYTIEEHNTAAGNIIRLFKESVLKETHDDYKVRNGEHTNIKDIRIYRVDYKVNGKPFTGKITVKETEKYGKKLYSIELLEIEKPEGNLEQPPNNQQTTPSSGLSTQSVAQEQDNVKKTLLPKGLTADVKLVGNRFKSIVVKFNGKKPKEVSGIMGRAGYQWDSKIQSWKARADNEQAMAIAKELGYKEQETTADKETATSNSENVVQSKQGKDEGGSQNDINSTEKLSQDDTGSRGTGNEVRGTAKGERPSAGDGQRSETPGEQGRSDSDNAVSGNRTAAGREASVREGSEETSAADDTSAGSTELSTSVVDSLQGKPDVEGQTTRDVVESVKDGRVNAADTVTTKVDKVIKENNLNSKRASRLRKTAKTMPFLSTIQLSNSDFVADRFTDNGKQGVMITDGTGTGKTFSGLAVAKELIEKGKDDVLIVTPSDSINNQWVNAAGEFFGINLNKLEDTKDAGQGAVITTYANLGANDALIKRNWDLVICDESHNLMNSEAGEKTAALSKMRQLTLHHTELHTRAEQLILPEEKLRARQLVAQAIRLKYKKGKRTDEDQAIIDEAGKIQQEGANELTKEEVAAIDAQVKDWEGLNETEKPKVMFMSATPFAYVPDIDYAEGYLFDYPKVEGGTYNQPGNGYSQFMMDHFGYRMRYNKLTKPDSKVDSSLMEVEFHEWLRKTGALAGHELEIDKDYNRGFLLVNQGVGQKIDEGFDFLQKHYNKYGQVLNVLRRQFDSRRRNYLLESIKARESVPIIKEYLKTGKKVVVFYETNVARESFNPFKFTSETQEALDTGKENAQQIKREWEMFAKERPDLVNLNLNDLKEPISIYREAFGNDAMFFNGRVPKKKRAEYVEAFNNDDSGKNLIFVQQDAGNAGISLHDTTGKHQRVLINIGIPRRPSYAIQIEGRIYRLGNKSNAIIRYLTTATNIENGLFAETVAGRASTAENLALGRKARGLRDSFKNAYQEVLDGSWESRMPGAEGEDIGGKENDRAIVSTSSDYDRAKAFYYARGKKTSKNKAAEGVDYFATPEPVGYKMVEWAGLKDGDKVLEPSAGHGAISRFFSPNTENTIIEPSGRLAPQAQMNTDNANLINGRFEELHISNKYDAITMNPPFGVGGKTAIEHLAKAFKHLRDGGRVIAIIPDGVAAEKRFNKWYESDDAKGAHMVGEVLLPSATFERAGTKVVTRIVLIDKGGESQGIKRIDLRSVDDINELFDKLENIEMPARNQKESAPSSNVKYESQKTEKSEAQANGSELATADTYKHTKTGMLIPHAKLNKSLTSEEYAAAKKLATENDGYYSKFARGFLFKTEEGRDKFVKELNEELGNKYSLSDEATTRSHAEVEAEIKKALPSAELEQQEDGSYIATMPNGKKLGIFIEDQILLNEQQAEEASRAHNRTADEAEGYWNSWERLEGKNVDGVLRVSRNSRVGTAFHETLHAAMDLCLTSKEKAALYKSFAKKAKESGRSVDEETADAYKEWAIKRQQGKGSMFGKLFQKAKDFLNKLYTMFVEAENKGNIFRKLESGKAWEQEVYSSSEAPKFNISSANIQWNKKEAVTTKRHADEISPQYTSETGSGNTASIDNLSSSEGKVKYSVAPGKNKIASTFTNTERKGAIQSIKDYAKDLKKSWYKDIVDKNNPLKGLDELTKATGGMSVYEKVQNLPATTAGTLKAVCEGTTEHLKAINSRLKKKMKYNVTLSMALNVVNKKTMDKAQPNYLEENGFKNWPDAFGAYLGVERELEMHEKAKAEGKTYTFSNNLTEAELREFVRKAPPQFAKAADMFYKVNDNMITIMEDAQVFSPKVAETLRKYKKYCPLQRDFSDTAAFDTFIGGLTSGGRGIGNVGVPLEKILIEGSDRTIMNPLESVLKSYAVMINRAERNRVGLMAVNAAKTAQLHDIIKEMPERKDSKGRIIEGVADPKNCIFTVLVNGRKKAYQTTQELYGPIVGYNLPAASLTLNVARMTAHMLRTGATMSPSFIIRNLIRDTVFAGISSKNGFIPIIDSIRGMIALKNDPAMMAEFEAAGVTGFNFYGSQASRIKSLDKMMGEQPVSLWEMLKWAGEHLEAASDFFESSTRMGEYMKARKNGLSMEEAARAAREVTLDFSRSGVVGERINRYVPFFNACIQGGDKMVRLFKEDPWGTSQKLFQYIVLPSLFLWGMNHDEDWYKDLDPDVKNNYWCLGEHLRIPKPQEAGVLFGSGIEALLDQASGKDKEAVWNAAKAFVSNMIPGIVPTLFLPLLEWQANYSYFKGKALVGSKYQRLPDELQYNDYTSELSKAIGNNPLYKVSPMKVDNLIRGYTGTMGALLWSTPDVLIGDSKNLPEKHLSERVFFRDFALTDANKSRPMNDFYDILDKANKQHAGYGVKGKPAEAVKGIRSAGSMIGKIRKDVDKITHSNLTPERKRELIDKRKEKMNQIAKKATERYGKYFE